MNIRDEMQRYIAEGDRLSGDEVTLIDRKGRRFVCLAIVGQLQTAREITSDQNIRPIRTAPIRIHRVSNPSLVEALRAQKSPAIPNDWKCEVFGKAWPIANSAVDANGFEFDIQQTIS